MRFLFCVILLAFPMQGVVAQDWRVNGVSRKTPLVESYKSNTPEGARFAEQASSKQIPDDSVLPYLTIIGTEEECLAVKKDIEGNGILGGMRIKQSFHVNYLKPDSWQVKSIGLAGGGRPDIVVQMPMDSSGRGRVILRQRDYSGGGDQLAKNLAALAIGAVRKPNVNYDPKNDPNPNSCPLGFKNSDWPAIFATLMIVLGIFVFSKKEK